MADGVAFGGGSGVLLLTDGSELLTALQSPDSASGYPGLHRGVPTAPTNWPKPRKSERQRIPVHDATPVVVQADSIDDIELVLLDLI